MSRPCCSFCEELPTIALPGWGARATKCPVCRQALWTTAAGATHRPRTAEELAALPPRSTRKRWLAGLGVAMAAGVCVLMLSQLAFAPATKVIPAPPPTPALTIEVANAEMAPPIPRPPRMRVKRADQPEAARAKPDVAPTTAELPRVIVKSSVKPLPVAFVGEIGQVKGTDRTIPAAWKWTTIRSGEDLAAQLGAVPEADFDPEYRRKTKKEIAAAAQRIVMANRDGKDAFIKKLLKDRPDLGGLPFLLGGDCSLSANTSKELARHSLEIRAALAVAERPRTIDATSRPYYSDVMPTEWNKVAFFWNALLDRRDLNYWKEPNAIPALQQILLAEHEGHRTRLVNHIKSIKGPQATEVLANRAVFDLDGVVRQNALLELRHRPLADQRAMFLKGLRYPWAPAVRHAAHAVVSLDLKAMVPDLVALLDEPDPGAPVVVPGDDGKPKHLVRELVRINHHRNCMLCHAPLEEGARVPRDAPFPVGPAPSADEPLPPSSSTVYYAVRNGSTVVRADITYLRQDFSLLQRVEKPGQWPDLQRFDFLVRTRELKDAEIALHPPVSGDTEHKQLIASALRALTGKIAEPTGQAWREVLGLPETQLMQRSKCMK